MKLSLSGRLVESGGGTLLPVGEFLDLAGRCGYDAVDLRASQLGPQTTRDEVASLRAGLARNGLAVFEGAWSGKLAEGDKEAARSFSAFAALLADLGAEGVRLSGDSATLKRACRLSAPCGLRVLYQMHTGGAFETLSAAARAVQEIGERNFGVMPEPANLLLAGEEFGEGMLAPLAGRILGVHVQTIELRAGASEKVRLVDGTDVPYERVPYARNRQIDFGLFFAALRQAGFDGYVNELEPCPGAAALEDTVRAAAAFLRPLL